MLNKKTVDDINVKGKKVLVRCDFNVPLKDGKITDDNRITAALPTIKKLVADGGKVILCSHLGKPKGEPLPELSLAPVAERLSEYLGQDVVFAADDNVTGPNAKKAVANMKDGDVVLLQNTRYRAEETKNEENFSKELAELARERLEVNVSAGDMVTWRASEPYDGIWCCASLIHLNDDEKKRFFGNLQYNLKPGGVIYISVKDGIESGVDEEGVYTSNCTAEELKSYLNGAACDVLETVVTEDAMGRPGVKWLNVIAKKRV